jgi:hypothetical protein
VSHEPDPHDEAENPERPDVLSDDELADEMGAESFPGSDPPSTWAGPDDEGHH